MTEIGAFEAKNKLSALLDLVEKGQEVTITRRGKPVAKLVAARPGEANKKLSPSEVVAEFRKLNKGVTLGGLKLKDLIDEGRK